MQAPRVSEGAYECSDQERDQKPSIVTLCGGTVHENSMARSRERFNATVLFHLRRERAAESSHRGRQLARDDCSRV